MLVSDRFLLLDIIFFFKQKTAYELRISDWSSDVCSSDLARLLACRLIELELQHAREEIARVGRVAGDVEFGARVERVRRPFARRDDALILRAQLGPRRVVIGGLARAVEHPPAPAVDEQAEGQGGDLRSGRNTSELRP